MREVWHKGFADMSFSGLATVGTMNRPFCENKRSYTMPIDRLIDTARVLPKPLPVFVRFVLLPQR